MKPDEFRQALLDMGLTQQEFGDLVGASRRTAVYWAAHAVPGPVVTIVRLIQRRPELLEVLREMASGRELAA